MNRNSHFSLRRLVQGLLLALLAFCVTPAQAQIYFTDYGAGTINTSDMNGANPMVLITDTNGAPWGIAVNQVTASGPVYVYYSDSNGFIGRVDPADITTQNDSFIDLTSISGAKPFGITVDAHYIYWADGPTGCIGRANKSDGSVPASQVSTHTPADYESFITGFAAASGVKVNGTNIFWTDGDLVFQTTYDGTDTGLGPVPDPFIDTPFINAGGFLTDLAVNTGYVYLADNGDGIISRAPISGSGGSISTTGIDGSFPTVIATNVYGIAVANNLYWATQSGLGSSTLDGGSVGSLFSSFTAGDQTYGIAIFNGATVITLTSFTATPKANQVVVAWQTGSEVDTAGFNIWRCATPTGTFAKVNAVLIPAQGTGVGGASYSWVDTNVSARQTWYYKLEDIDTHGLSTMHGPVSAIVGAVSPILSFQATPTDIFLGGRSFLSWTVIGNPALSLSGLGPVSTSNLWVSPISSTSYTLTDGIGDQNIATVNVKSFGLLDIPGLSKAWGSVKGDANYNPSYDLNGDGKVDDQDVALCFKGL
jgi:membrane-bound inhibitor of C-type lysozyme